MKALNKKLFRDIFRNKPQFISIFLMVFLGIFCFAGIHAYMDGMRVSGDEYYENYNLQDLMISCENFTEDDLTELKGLDNVKDAERVLQISTTLEGFDDVMLDTIFLESNRISKFYVKEGEPFDKDKSGVWLDSYLAENLDIHVGDELPISYKTYKLKEKVLGLVNTPDHVYTIKDDATIFPTHQDFGYVYLSVHEFPLEMMVFNQVYVDVDDTEQLQKTKQNIENEIEPAIAVTTREEMLSYECYQDEINEGQTYSTVFTGIFLFIAILSVITTMYRFVRKQRIQIGTLKALGIRKRKIIVHYVSFGFWISLIAGVAGLILGNFILGGFFLNMEMEYFEVPVSHTEIIPMVYILALVTVLVITVVTYFSCRKVLREKAADAIRVEVPKVKTAKSNLTKNGIFKNASVATKWNLRDIGRNKGRTFMGAVGVIGCAMILVCAFGMLDTMNSYLDWEFDTIYHFAYKLELEHSISEETLQQLTDKYGTHTSKTYGIEVKDNGEKKANTLTVNDSGDLLQYTDHNRNAMQLKDNGIYLTEKLAKTLDKKVGDEIEWHIFGEDTWYQSKIVGLNRDPQNQNVNMTRAYFESLEKDYQPDTIYTNDDLKDTSEIDGVETIKSKESLKDGMMSMLNTMRTMIVILILVSAILGFVIIYNLGILSFAEKQYQFATLKVLGYKNQQIKKIFVMQNIWITIVSVIIGLPLGYWLTSYIFTQALGDNYDFPANIKALTYVYGTIGTFIVAFVVNRFLARKVKNIDMVTSLKGNE